jgi:thymidylate synthase ThyX
MKVTHTPIRPSQAAEAANRPALTPELLAATGARYSRNNEGLEAIYSKIDPVNPDKSVDSIFKMVDYGHASIADMAPVAMFIDGVSQYLAYLLWAISPTASGQESSTRYIQYTSQSILEYELTGLSGLVSEKEYNDFVSNSFKLYDQMLNFWTEYSVKNPLAMRIPESMIKDDSPKAQKTVERLRRNFAFDRSRVLLPMPVKTNVMMVNTARNWVEVCKYLLSSDLPEAQKCGELIKAELALVTPRLIRHANKDFASSAYWEEYKKENQSYAEELKKSVPAVESGSKTSRKVEDRLVIFEKIAEEKVLANLKYRTNRYSRCGNDLSAMPVRMELSGCTLGDLRDLNRHRTFPPKGACAST